LSVTAGIVIAGTDLCGCTLLFHCPNVRAVLFCRTFSELLNLVIFEEVLFLRTSLGNLKVSYARGGQTLETLTRVELRMWCHSDCVNLHLSGRQLETGFCYPSLLTEVLCRQVIWANYCQALCLQVIWANYSQALFPQAIWANY